MPQQEKKQDDKELTVGEFMNACEEFGGRASSGYELQTGVADCKVLGGNIRAVTNKKRGKPPFKKLEEVEINRVSGNWGVSNEDTGLGEKDDKRVSPQFYGEVRDVSIHEHEEDDRKKQGAGKT
jgi:hypothetical protein